MFKFRRPDLFWSTRRSKSRIKFILLKNLFYGDGSPKSAVNNTAYHLSTLCGCTAVETGRPERMERVRDKYTNFNMVAFQVFDQGSTENLGSSYLQYLHFIRSTLKFTLTSMELEDVNQISNCVWLLDCINVQTLQSHNIFHMPLQCVQFSQSASSEHKRISNLCKWCMHQRMNAFSDTPL